MLHLKQSSTLPTKNSNGAIFILRGAMEQARRLRDVGRRHGRYQSKFTGRHEPKTRHLRPILRPCLWESLFMRKSNREKREVIQRPWELPMAAQHLSAILIQKLVRGVLTRLHLRRDIHWRPLVQTKSTLVARRHVPSPMQRFISHGGSFGDDIEFRHFVATRIQAWYRKEKQRWRYTVQRFPLYQIAALQIQYTWKTHREERSRKFYGVPPRTRAALVLQAAWKSYTNRRIFRYYRDLITFHNTGDPTHMLRAINPSEASLLDATMGAHVRFRLGGVSFPPTFYYKIFTRKAVCDLGAFSPKDYTISRQVAPTSHSNQAKTAKNAHQKFFIRVGHSYYRAKRADEDTSYWYRRIENNGWRPVTAKVMTEANNDPVAMATSKKSVPNYHHLKTVRKQDMERQRRLKKRQWMHKLYTQGLLREAPGGAQLAAAHPELRGELLFDVDFDNDNWEEDAEDMFQWASALDFDEYVEEWQALGKTASTDDDPHMVLPGM